MKEGFRERQRRLEKEEAEFDMNEESRIAFAELSFKSRMNYQKKRYDIFRRMSED